MNTMPPDPARLYSESGSVAFGSTDRMDEIERTCACGCGARVGSERRPGAAYVRGHNLPSVPTVACDVCGRVVAARSLPLHLPSHDTSRIAGRFWANVTRRRADQCWDWNGRLHGGYGRFYSAHESYVMAHRYAYEQVAGAVPDGLELDHLCRNRRCVNPAHLEPVTGQVNTLRGIGLTAINARKTHCLRGHEYTPENTRYRPDGSRRCWECHRIHDATARAVRKARAEA